MTRLALALCLVSSLAAAPAGAAAPKGESKARKLIQSAAKLYDDLEYEKALGVLKKARRVVRTPDEGVEVDLYEGIFSVLMGREGDATLAFTRALIIKPEATLPIRVSPKVQQAFDDVRAGRGLLPPEPKPPPDPAPAPAPTPPPVARTPEPMPAPAATSVPAATAAAEAPRPAGGRSVRPLAIIPAIGGSLLAGAGVVLCVVAKGDYDRLENDTLPIEIAEQTREEGKLLQGLGIAGLAVGGAALAAATVMLIAGGPSEAPAVSFVPVPGGAVLSFGAPLP